MSFLQKLQSEPAKEQTSKEIQSENNEPSIKVVSENHDSEDQVGVTEQLESLYSDIEYLNTLFPDHSIRTIADHAKNLESKINESITKAAAKGEVEDHGLIPGTIYASLSSLDQKTADQADVGIVEVDDKGNIKLYNDYEAELAAVDKNAVMGKNFFTQVAPCTNNRLFLGAFKQGVQTNSIDKKFNYTFTYKMKPTPVVIQIYREETSGRNFIFVAKR